MINSLRKKFPDSRVVVTHIDRGAELARFSDEFEKQIDRLDELKSIKMSVQAAVGGGLLRNITIDLGQIFNRVTTQGPDEAWVLGEAEATFSVLKQREKRLSTALGRYRVNINQVIALGALAVMPDLVLFPRCLFVTSVVLLLIIAGKMQTALIPNLIIDFSKKPTSWFSQAWPSIYLG